METIQGVITQEHIERGMDYITYRSLINQLLNERKTTGENHSESLLDYTRLNVQRMNKWDKIFKPKDQLVKVVESIDEPVNWVVLTEAWCGDAAQNLPTIAKLASMNPNISLKLLLRDENIEVMDAYRTSGGMSIPKLIMLDHEYKELGQWGPRPEPVQQILKEMKASGTFSYDEFGIIAHTWYAKDRTKTLQRELLNLLS